MAADVEKKRAALEAERKRQLEKIQKEMKAQEKKMDEWTKKQEKTLEEAKPLTEPFKKEKIKEMKNEPVPEEEKMNNKYKFDKEKKIKE